MEAMLREISGRVWKFMPDPPKDNPNKSMPQLKPVCFGSRSCKGYETRLHSYLGEGFRGDWALGKFHHYLWGMRNTWATNKYALIFLINYDNGNGPFCRLQIRIMMMRIDIVHQNATFVGGDDYG